MIGQGEMLNTPAVNVDTTIDNQPVVLPEPGQEMFEYTPWPPPPAAAPGPHTSEPHPQPWTLENNPLGGIHIPGLLTPQEPSPTVPTLWETEATVHTSDVHLNL